MIPDKLIWRNDCGNGTPGFVFFSKETIKKIKTKFHKEMKGDNVNINHDGKMIIDVEMIDSFLLNRRNSHKVSFIYKKMPEGTWFITYKSTNLELNKKIINDELKGFSIEGKFI